MIPTGCEYNTNSRFNISRTSWNWHFIDFIRRKKRGHRKKEVIGGSGSDRGSVGDDSLACMTSYLWNSVMKTRHLSRTSCGCPPHEMFDELLTRVGTSITKQNTNYREALHPGLKLAFTLRHLASGTKYHSMSYGWRVPHNTISLLIPKVYQAIIDEYKVKCPTTPEEWRRCHIWQIRAEVELPQYMWCTWWKARQLQVSSKLWFPTLYL